MSKFHHFNPLGKNLGTRIIEDYTTIDLETTGLFKEKDYVIEFGAVKIRQFQVVDKLEIFVDYRKENYDDTNLDPYFCKVNRLKSHWQIPSLIEKITGIGNQFIDDLPPGQRDCLDSALQRFLNFIGDDILLGQNVSFDFGFIEAACRCCLRKSVTNNYFDTLTISKLVLPQLRRHSLKAISQALGIGNVVAHKALEDAMQTHLCYKKMLPLIREYNEPLFWQDTPPLEILDT